MTVTVRLFAMLREAKGTDRVELELEPGDTPSALFERLFADRPHPRWPGTLMYAINREYAAADAPLQDGDEVAFVPPLGGGEGDDARVSLHHDQLPVSEVIARVEGPDKGGITVFTGVVRNTFEGQPVTHLEYEAFEPMALQEMGRICDAVETQWPGAAIAVGHRLGRLEIGDAAVTIAVATPHRAASFEGCRFAIDTLKKTVPIFKKEVYQDGSEWKDQTGG